MDGRIYNRHNAMTIARWPSASGAKKIQSTKSHLFNKIDFIDPKGGNVLLGVMDHRDALTLPKTTN